MARRKWLFFGSVLLVLLLLAAGTAWLYLWIQSGVIRQKLLAHLQEQFDNVDVEAGTVWWLPWSSIHVNDLRLIRRDDPTRSPFLSVHQVRIYPDKEQFSQGQIIIRKIELDRPHLHVSRNVDGKWNLADIVRIDKTQDGRSLPLLQIQHAKVTLIDRELSKEPLLHLHDVSATIINDPLPIFSIRVAGKGQTIGDFGIQGQFNRATGFAGSVDLSSVSVTPDLVKLAALWFPELQEHLQHLQGTAIVHLDLSAPNGGTITPDVRVQFRDGRWSPPWLPTPLEQIQFDAQVRNGDLTVEILTARAGTAKLTFSIELARDRIRTPVGVPLAVPSRNALPPQAVATAETSPLQDIENRLRKLDLSVQNISLHPELFSWLPPRIRIINDMFAPSGSLDLSYSYVRREGLWHKKMIARPTGLDALYRGFPYPMKGIRGKIEYDVDSFTDSLPDEVKLDLTAEGCGSSVNIQGTIKGTSPDLDVDLHISGKGVTLDNQLVAALPDDNPKLINRLHATAFGDFTAHIRHNERIRREHGPDVFDNLFTIHLLQASLNYEGFPYALENLTGTLIIRTVPVHPTRLPPTSGLVVQKSFGDTGVLEFHDFKATHRGSLIRGNGRKDPVPGGSLLDLQLHGENIQLDRDLRTALAGLRLESSWSSIDPQGQINCNVHVRLMDRSTPDRVFNPVDDLQMTMAFNGASVRPNFFAYSFHGVSGAFRYARGRVEMEHFAARHGQMQISLPKAEVLMRASGGYWADLRELQVTPFVIDADFIKALPPGLRSACEGLELKGKMKLYASRIVIDEQPGPFQPRYLPAPGPRATNVSRTKPTDLLPKQKDENQESKPAEKEQKGGPATDFAKLHPEAAPLPTRSKEPLPILPTIYWDGSIAMEGASTQLGVPWEDIHGKFACWGVYRGDQLGAVRGNIDIAKALLSKQPVETIRAKMWVDPKQPELLQVGSVTGKFFAGDVGGQGWVAMQTPVRYALNLQATRIQLAEIARHYQLGPKVHLEGLASAQLYLHNKIDDRTGMPVVEGAGTLDVPSGKLLNLPFLLNLIKVAKLHAPDQTGFEEAHVLFSLKGKRVKFSQLDLIGNAISLGGEGEMNTDGSDVNVAFYPVWTKMKELFSLSGGVSAEVSKMVFKVKVSGQLDGQLDYKPEPVPLLVDPIRRVLDKMKQ